MFSWNHLLRRSFGRSKRRLSQLLPSLSWMLPVSASTVHCFPFAQQKKEEERLKQANCFCVLFVQARPRLAILVLSIPCEEAAPNRRGLRRPLSVLGAYFFLMFSWSHVLRRSFGRSKEEAYPAATKLLCMLLICASTVSFGPRRRKKKRRDSRRPSAGVCVCVCVARPGLPSYWCSVFYMRRQPVSPRPSSAFLSAGITCFVPRSCFPGPPAQKEASGGARGG